MSTTELPFGDINSHHLTEKDITNLLYRQTGCIYTFATSSELRWGKDGEIMRINEKNPNGFFQLMPHAMDDGFFDWYCNHREHFQFFISKESATLHFIHYWLKWKSTGKPKPF